MSFSARPKSFDFVTAESRVADKGGWRMNERGGETRAIELRKCVPMFLIENIDRSG